MVELTELTLLDRYHSREEREMGLLDGDPGGTLFAGVRLGIDAINWLNSRPPVDELIVRTARQGLTFADGFIALHPAAAHAAGFEPGDEPFVLEARWGAGCQQLLVAVGLLDVAWLVRTR